MSSTRTRAKSGNNDGTQVIYVPATGQYDGPRAGHSRRSTADNHRQRDVRVNADLDHAEHGRHVPAYRIIYLQRLADPTRPWVAERPRTAAESDATANPYRTVDAMTVDLTCFNGVTSAIPTPIRPDPRGHLSFRVAPAGRKELLAWPTQCRRNGHLETGTGRKGPSLGQRCQPGGAPTAACWSGGGPTPEHVLRSSGSIRASAT